MVRVVPIVHRTPPPPLDGIFEPEEDDKMEESSSSSISRPVPDGASKLQRRSYLTSKASPNIASSSNSSTSAPTNGETRSSNPKFSLFDYLQELVRLLLAFLLGLFYRSSSKHPRQLNELKLP